MNERATEEDFETSPEEVEVAPAPDQEISDIFENALKDKVGSPEDANQRVEETEERVEKPEASKQVIETPFGEITLADAKKLAFKTKDEWSKFVETNPFLKDQTMLKADHTRKTQELAKERENFTAERKKFEEEKLKSEQVWGGQPLSETEIGLFQNLRSVYQYGTDQLAGTIEKFLGDINLIAQGRPPVGPLANASGQHDFTRDSELITLRQKLDKVEAESKRFMSEREKQDKEREKEAAVSEVSSWISEKEKQGVQIDQELLNAMALFSGNRDKDGKRISLDKMHRLALVELGREEKETLTKAVTSLKDHSKRTPVKPASRVPSSARPEAKNFEDVFKQGLEDLKG